MRNGNWFLAVLATCLAGLASAEVPKSPDIRFCPAGRIRTFPLESQRGVEGLLLQNAVIINHGPEPFEITAIDLELLQDGKLIDARRIAGDELMKGGKTGGTVQSSGLMKAFAFQFCGSALVGDGITLGGPMLGANQGYLLIQQPFAFKGKRDTLRLHVRVSRFGQNLDVAETLPIDSGFAKTKFRFPLAGASFAAVGPTLHTAHRWALPEEFAYDIARIGEGNLSHRGDGQAFTDYYAYGLPVLAAADGTVAMAVNDQPEDLGVLRKPGEAVEAYGARLQALQGALLARGVRAIAGNLVMLDHGNGEYSLYAHLVPGSVKVRVGDKVSAGAVLGKLGSSGNSTEPHLHFQVCDAPDPLACAGIPVAFENIELPYADFPRPVQSGDVVLAH